MPRRRRGANRDLTWVRIPDALNVGAVYGIGATVSDSGGAGFVPFALGPQGRATLAADSGLTDP